MAEMTLSELRTKLLFDAACELDKLSRILPDLVSLSENQEHYAVKGIAGRMVRLTTALIHTLGDDGSFTDEEVQEIVNFGSVGHA